MKFTSFSHLLRTCASLSSINQLKQAHAQVVTSGLLPSVTLSTDLLLAYARCSKLQHARSVFDEMSERNIYSWNILISSYVQNFSDSDAMDLFLDFLKQGLRPDHYTLPAAFKACAEAGSFWLGQSLHNWVIKLGFEDYVFVCTFLMDLYVKYGDLSGCKRVFHNMSYRDLVAWNTMISGLGKAGRFHEALNYFRCMLREGIEMDSRTVPSLLDACGEEGDLLKGKEIHGKVVKSSVLDSDVAIRNAMISMYSRCGCSHCSEFIFMNMREKNLITWTTMISCYGHHGKGEKALALFHVMQTYGLRPNSVALTAILTSCNHSGLVDQGQMIFNSMKSDYGLEPTMEHYACMVDQLGRCGRLKEAFELIKNVNQVAQASIWGALLASCVIHKNVDIGEIAARHLFLLEPRNSSNFIALCSIYDSMKMDGDVSRIRSMMRVLGLVKTPGCSWITVAGKVYKFYQGDLSHPLAKLICETLDFLTQTITYPKGYAQV